MLTFNYTAYDPTSRKRVSAQVEAQDEHAAANVIKKEGLTPIEIKVVNKFNIFSKYLDHVGSKDKVLFSRQLSTLLNAGLPLLQALRSVSDQTTKKPLKVIINDIVTAVEGGSSFSAALSKHKDVFNDVFISLVAAGEASGTLDKSLERLANQQEKDADIVSKIRGAFAYPVIVILVMLAVVTFMMVKVLPAVNNLYESLPGVSLPLITRILFGVSHIVIRFWYVFVIVIGVVVFFSTRFARTIAGKSVFDKVKMKTWPFGPLFMKVYMARFSRTASTLVASGVPLIQVLEITSHAVNNVHISASINKAIENVKGGGALSDSLEKDNNFLPLVPSMLRIGEQSGTIEQMLERVAVYYEVEVDNEIKTISTLMEPILMVILGIFAFIIVAAVLLPIYSLAGNSSLTTAF